MNLSAVSQQKRERKNPLLKINLNKEFFPSMRKLFENLLLEQYLYNCLVVLHSLFQTVKILLHLHLKQASSLG